MRRRIRKTRMQWLALSLCAFVVALGGCSKSPYEVARAGGKITVDGKPLTSGSVVFAPITTKDKSDPGKPAYGEIQSDGTFVLGTYSERDGAIVGQHTVTVYAGEGDDKAKAIPPFDVLRVPGAPKEVAAGRGNEFSISLTSAEIKKYGEIRD